MTEAAVPRRSLTTYGTDQEALGAATLQRGFAVVPRLLPYVRPYWGRFALMCIVTVLSSAMKISGLLFIKPFGDIILGTFDVEQYAALPFLDAGIGHAALMRFAAILAGDPHLALLTLIGFLLGMLGVHALSALAAEYLQQFIGGRIGLDVQRELVDRVLTQPVSFFSARGKGELLNVLQVDTVALYRTLYIVFDRFVRGAIEVIAALSLALALDWRLTILAGAIGGPAALIVQAMTRRMRKQERASFHFGGVGGLLLQEVLAAPQTVKAFLMEPYLADRLEWARRKRFRLHMSLVKTRAWMGPSVEVLIALVIAGFVYYNGRELMSGRVDVSEFIMLYGCLGALISPVRKGVKGYGEFVINTQSVYRVFDLMDRAPAVADDPDAGDLRDVHGRVDFEDVSFTYPTGQEALRSVTLTIAPGERVALVGPSGAGKSTLASLLLRFYDPTEGRILIDGQGIAHVRQESLRQHVGLVPQDTVLFSDTVRMNITCGRAAEPGAVEAAAQAAQAHEFIMALPSGYDTSIGDMGTNLSGGQRQRLSVARCLFRNTPILILDEATSSLDAVTEAEIQEEFEILTANRTTIVIAHRFSTIMNADRIVFLHHGRVMASGTHDELYATNQQYRDLFERQLLFAVADGEGATRSALGAPASGS